MSRRRVVVTGLGAVTALGADLASLDRGLREGLSAIRPLTLFDASGFRTQLAGQAPEPKEPESLGAHQQSRPDRFGLQAAEEAIARAGLTRAELAESAVVFGTGTGGPPLTARYLIELRRGAEPPAALLLPHQPASVTDLVARRLGARGPRSTIMTACSSSATAIGFAADRIRLGQVNLAAAGGGEPPLRPP